MKVFLFEMFFGFANFLINGFLTLLVCAYLVSFICPEMRESEMIEISVIVGLIMSIVLYCFRLLEWWRNPIKFEKDYRESI